MQPRHAFVAGSCAALSERTAQPCMQIDIAVTTGGKEEGEPSTNWWFTETGRCVGGGCSLDQIFPPSQGGFFGSCLLSFQIHLSALGLAHRLYV